MGSIKTNRFYNDPNIGAAFENIASIFAPPSAQDTAAYAVARAKNEESKRLSWLFDNPLDATASERSALTGIQNFGATPDGFSAADATMRRGQDVTASTQRYGIDVGATTSRSNNAADNVRALTDREMQEAGAMSRLGVTDATDRRGQDIVAATSRGNNEADNVRALQERQMQEDGALARFYAAPVTVKQGERAFLPNQTTAATGLPAQLEGSEAPLSTDEVAALAMQAMPLDDRKQFVRDKFAPTETQVQGQERRGLVASGALSQDNLVDTIMGSVPVEQVVGRDGRPEFVQRSDAVGRQPFVNAGAAAKPELQNWIGPNGSGGGTATFDTTAGRWFDTATKQPLPAGSRTYTGQLTGGSDATGLGPTVANATSANNQEAEITRTLGTLDVYENLIDSNPGAIGLAGLVRGTAQNATATLTDLAGSFGGVAPKEIADTAAEIKAGLEALSPGLFDKSIPEAQFIQSTLAYALVRSENPSGEVSRQAYEDALRRVQGGGLLANSQSAKAAISAQRRLLQNQLVGVRALRNPGQGRTDAGYRDPQAAPGAAPVSQTGPADAGAVERWERGPDGKMRKAQ